MFAVYLAGCDEDKRGEGDHNQYSSRDAVELTYFAIEKSEAYEDEEDMSAEDLERCLAQGKEWLNLHDAGNGFAQPVDHAGKGDEVQHAKRPKLPLIELQSKGP